MFGSLHLICCSLTHARSPHLLLPTVVSWNFVRCCWSQTEQGRTKRKCGAHAEKGGWGWKDAFKILLQFRSTASTGNCFGSVKKRIKRYQITYRLQSQCFRAVSRVQRVSYSLLGLHFFAVCPVARTHNCCNAEQLLSFQRRGKKLQPRKIKSCIFSATQVADAWQTPHLDINTPKSYISNTSLR